MNYITHDASNVISHRSHCCKGTFWCRVGQTLDLMDLHNGSTFEVLPELWSSLPGRTIKSKVVAKPAAVLDYATINPTPRCLAIFVFLFFARFKCNFTSQILKIRDSNIK